MRSPSDPREVELFSRTNNFLKSAEVDRLEMKRTGTDSVQSLGKGWGMAMRGKLGSDTGADINKEIVH